jgi:hypothetical protein
MFDFFVGSRFSAVLTFGVSMCCGGASSRKWLFGGVEMAFVKRLADTHFFGHIVKLNAAVEMFDKQSH